MARTPTLTISKVSNALMLHHGVLLTAAEACGVTRQALNTFMRNNPELYEVRDEAVEQLLDIAENNITAAVKGGDMKTTRWYAERKGKNRGYSTRVETTGKDGAPIQTDVNHAGYDELASLLDGAARTRESGAPDAGELAQTGSSEPTPTD